MAMKRLSMVVAGGGTTPPRLRAAGHMKYHSSASACGSSAGL